jgi:hypothetical protein
MAFYQGRENQVSGAGNVKPTREGRAWLVTQKLPLLREDTAALALATLQSLLRAPEVKMAMIMPIVGAVVLCSASISKRGGDRPENLMAFAVSAAVIFGGISVAQLMSNAFGLDRNGFRALVLLPTPRQRILLAKNFAFFPFVAVITLVLVILLKILLGVTIWNLLAGLAQIPLSFLMLSLVCNFAAILAPYRFTMGTLQAKKPKAIVFLSMLFSMFALPLVAVPAVIGPGVQLLFGMMGWVQGLPVNLLVSLLLIGPAAWLYSALLPLQGRLLQKREQKILNEVTTEIE